MCLFFFHLVLFGPQEEMKISAMHMQKLHQLYEAM